MSVTQKLTVRLQGGSSAIEKAFDRIADAEINISAAVITGGTTNLNQTIDVSELEIIYITSDKAVTIDTDGVDQAALTLAAGEVILWYTGCGATCPLTADCTQIHVTNESGTTANVIIKGLQDPTP